MATKQKGYKFSIGTPPKVEISMEKEILLELKNIKKTFGKVVALDNVDVCVRKGEIHGLLGENGAGKSALMNILYGLYHPDEGEISFEGRRVTIRSPHDSIRLGIGMVHQLSTLVPEFTAIENIILGTEGDKYTLPSEKEKRRIERISDELGLRFPLDVRVKRLPAGIKQKIEIVRALYREAKLLILDEPTTSMVESEFRQLLKSLKVLVGRGVTVIFITHKIREIMEASDSVTVLRKGKKQGFLKKGRTTKENLVRLMFLEKDIRISESAVPKVELPSRERSEKPVVVVKNISVQTGQRSVGLRNVSFEIYGGEILGIAAVSGNGEKEIAEVMVRPSLLSRGEILVNGKSINGLSTAEVFMEGVFYTPEDRIKEGILNEGNINENVLLGHQTEKRFLRNKIFINWNEVRKATKKTIKDYNIYTPSGELAIRRLSGGNIQKVIIGRALLGQISFLVTHNPTSGLDISSVEFIFGKLVDTRNSGGAVLWVGEDLDELMMISDRIAVLYNGELKAIFTRCEFDKYKIGLLMIGD